jgi:hypothetical protein
MKRSRTEEGAPISEDRDPLGKLQQEMLQQMNLFRAIYSSRPFGFDEGILNGILTDARRANQRDGITGALICRAIFTCNGSRDRKRM